MEQGHRVQAQIDQVLLELQEVLRGKFAVTAEAYEKHKFFSAQDIQAFKDILANAVSLSAWQSVNSTIKDAKLSVWMNHYLEVATKLLAMRSQVYQQETLGPDSPFEIQMRETLAWAHDQMAHLRRTY